MSPFAQAMRDRWADHIDRTREYLLASPAAASSALARLLANQDDLGALFAIPYGPEAGHRVSQLLRDHIRIAGDIIVALRSGKDPASLLQAWDRNASQIADAIHSLNPTFLSKPDLLSMMRHHLDLTKNEVVSEIQGRPSDSIAYYHAARTAARLMADDLSSAIQKQIPALAPQVVGVGYPTSTCPPGQTHAYGAGGENGADPGCEMPDKLDQMACGDHAAFSHLQCTCQEGYSPRSDGGKGCEYTGGITGGANVTYTPPSNGGSGPGGTPTMADYNLDTDPGGTNGTSSPNQKPFPWIPIALIVGAVGTAYVLATRAPSPQRHRQRARLPSPHERSP